MKYLLLAAALLLFGCITGNEAPTPTLIGFSFKCDTSCQHPGGEFTAWPMRADTLSNHTFLIFAKVADLANLGPRTRRALQAYPKNVPIYDAGGHCLTFHQTGIDTVMLDGQRMLLAVPVEPCFPYLDAPTGKTFSAPPQ